MVPAQSLWVPEQQHAIAFAMQLCQADARACAVVSQEVFGFSDVKTYNSTVVLTVKPGSMADVTDIFMKTLISDGMCVSRQSVPQRCLF